MTIALTPLSCSPKAQNWLKTSQLPRVLHVFRAALNLINEKQEVLSLVTSEIGNGPFSLVVKEVNFVDFAVADTPIRIAGQALWIGPMQCPTDHIPRWSPQPDWDALRAQLKSISAQIPCIETALTEQASSDSLSLLFAHPASKPHFLQYKIMDVARAAIELLAKGLSTQDLTLIQGAAEQLAGLGLGLTPAGDDYLMGVIYGLWLAFPKNFATQSATLIYQTAKNKTNHLSAAWLGAAMDRETGETWLEFFAAFLSQENALLPKSITRILATGHTSGADALGGFMLALKNQPNAR